MAVPLVSHRLAEVLEVSDRIVVMRDGQLCGDHRTSETSRDQIIAEMIGRSVGITRTRSTSETNRPALVIEGLTVEDPLRPNRPAAQSVNLTLHWGEVLGLFGLTGSGCSAVAQAMFGAWRGRWRGEMALNGVPLKIRRPGDAIRADIGLVASDRRASLVMGLSVAENVALSSLSRLSRGGLLDVAARDALVESYRQKLSIRTTSPHALVSSLSGGNQQKVQVARLAGRRVQGSAHGRPMSRRRRGNSE